jgi:hypothetical protein
MRPETGCDHVILASEPGGEQTLLQDVITEMRAFGFSASGKCLVVATSSDIELYRLGE